MAVVRKVGDCDLCAIRSDVDLRPRAYARWGILSNMGQQGGAWWVDDPIESRDADSLDRVVFVDGVQDLIERVGESPASTVIGLIGPWGSGKTSTVKMIVGGLDRTNWGIAQITPWALIGGEAVIAELLAGIVAALPDEGRKAKRVRKAIEEYGAFVTPLLSAVPAVGEMAKGLADVTLERFGAVTVQQQTDRVAERLRKLASPVLVVVDDIDRLQHEELLALFRGVRVLGRLPYVHYLLAYDEQTVLDVLQATEIANKDRMRAFAFLEKIVSLRLDQPPTRLEQADVMLARALQDVVEEHLGLRLSESQRSRLDDEREALLSAILTEPRSIRRFITQLRTYLPIVGPSEVDFVDYAVITLFRLAYPDLFRAAAQQKAVLVGASPADDEADLAVWTSGSKLDRYGVPDHHAARVTGAIHRLFPRTARANASNYILAGDKFRRDRRATSPDYFDKYFALTAPTVELADAVITDALREWATGQLGTADTELRVALKPDPSDSAACARAARLIRRAGAYSEELDGTETARVLRMLFSQLPVTPNADIDSAMSAWIASLLAKSSHADPTEVLQLLERAPEEPSPIHYLLRATRLAIMPSADGREWLDDLISRSTTAVWNRFITHVQLADAAPAEPIGSMLNWLEENAGPEVLRQKLANALDEGLSLPNLAGRMLEVQVEATGRQSQLMHVDTDLFVRRLGLQRILQRLDELRAGARPSSEALNFTDLSWPNRRTVASSELCSAEAQDALIRLPALDIIETPPGLHNHEPDLISSARPGQEPDLKVQLTILLPSGATTPSLDGPRSGQPEEERESVVLQLLAQAPITNWLAEVSESWHVTARDWSISDSNPNANISAIHRLDVDNRSASQPKPPIPLAIGAQLRIGQDQSSADANRPALLLTIAVGMWLVELSGDRRQDEVRHTQDRPLPAALSLSELVELVAALLRTVTTAFDAFDQLVHDPTPPLDAAVDLRLQTTGGPSAVIDLRDVQLFRDGSRVDHRLLSRIQRRDAAYDEASLAHAAAAIDRWLRDAGYRGHSAALLELIRDRSR